MPSEEQASILDELTSFMDANLPISRLRPGATAAQERDSFAAMAELGWFGLGLDEASGGVGYSLGEEMLLFREAGRHLLSPALLGQTLGARVAAAAGNSGLVQQVVTGARRVAVGNPLRPMPIGPSTSGEAQLFDAGDADLILLWNEDAAALFPKGAFGNTRLVPCIDDGISIERGRLDGAAPVAMAAAADEPLARRANVLVAATLVGMAEAATDMAVEHAKTREQFGQAIGGFQAVKHRCADMAVRAEAARWQTVFAALAEGGRRADGPFQGSAARLLARSAALANAAANIQVHGGMGFTAECDAQLVVKRAHVFDQIGGGPRHHQARLLTQVAET